MPCDLGFPERRGVCSGGRAWWWSRGNPATRANALGPQRRGTQVRGDLDEQIKALEADTPLVVVLQNRVTRTRAETPHIDAATKVLEEFKASYISEQIAAEGQVDEAAKREERRRGAMAT